MAKRMLIDATHPEETRVVVLAGNRLEDFDFETSTKKQLKGNIYLAKVSRVEPSLQAAFVDYGGNRHGFLAFSEIHPDYYQIPVADRERLLAEMAKIERGESTGHESGGRRRDRDERRGGRGRGRRGERRDRPADGEATVAIEGEAAAPVAGDEAAPEAVASDEQPQDAVVAEAPAANEQNDAGPAVAESVGTTPAVIYDAEPAQESGPAAERAEVEHAEGERSESGRTEAERSESDRSESDREIGRAHV